MKISIRTICFTGMFTAIISVLSILTIPTPWGVPFTLQTFAIALAGFVLGKKYGTISVALYVLLGLIGVPVYAGMKAGPGVLFGATGGYIFGFILMAFFSGLAMESVRRNSKKVSGMVLAVLFSILGLACCHILGSIQLKFVIGSTLLYAFSVGSLPYLVKDIAFVAVAYVVALAVCKALSAANLLDWNKAAA